MVVVSQFLAKICILGFTMGLSNFLMDKFGNVAGIDFQRWMFDHVLQDPGCNRLCDRPSVTELTLTKYLAILRQPLK